ncbi:MAG TPA: right-handed parallel beta-helix repeat-containing protein [Holophagaceae bacterium]|nr:right-handed parallel beta-helix repeat-containing protein [Holophagaceae bacterium]
MRAFVQRACFGLALILAAIPLTAQATRTWISGVGDDANPGSRTAPCKTFAGAISKTAAGGEVDCLDPGGFGGVTITKSITFDGGGGQVASILVAGTNGIVVAAGANDVVIIRNMRLQGISGTGSGGLNGIRFLSGKALIIENCIIDGFTQSGVDIALGNAADVRMSNVSIENSHNGVTIESTNTAAVNLSMEHVRVWESSNVGFYLVGLGKATLRNSDVAGCVYGMVVDKADVQADELNASHNSYVGVQVVGGSLRISNSIFTGNANGFRLLGGSTSSYGNNRVDGNTAGNGPLSTISQK